VFIVLGRVVYSVLIDWTNMQDKIELNTYRLPSWYLMLDMRMYLTQLNIKKVVTSQGLELFNLMFFFYREEAVFAYGRKLLE